MQWYCSKLELTATDARSHPLFTKEEMEDGDGVKRAAIRKLEHELGIPESSFRVADMRYLTTILYKVRALAVDATALCS